MWLVAVVACWQEKDGAVVSFGDVLQHSGQAVLAPLQWPREPAAQHPQRQEQAGNYTSRRLKRSVLHFRQLVDRVQIQSAEPHPRITFFLFSLQELGLEPLQLLSLTCQAN